MFLLHMAVLQVLQAAKMAAVGMVVGCFSCSLVE